MNATEPKKASRINTVAAMQRICFGITVQKQNMNHKKSHNLQVSARLGK